MAVWSSVHFDYILLGLLCILAGQLLQPPTAAKQLNIQHQLIPGSNFQLLLDAAVMLLDRVNTDEGLGRVVPNIIPVDVIVEYPPFRRGKGFGFFR